MKRPSADDMHLAAMWLEVYEGAEDAEACKRVSQWLREQSDKAEFDAAARKIAKETGRLISEVRAHMRQKQNS